jgi:hypothetical protein
VSDDTTPARVELAHRSPRIALGIDLVEIELDIDIDVLFASADEARLVVKVELDRSPPLQYRIGLVVPDACWPGERKQNLASVAVQSRMRFAPSWISSTSPQMGNASWRGCVQN